MSFNSTIYLGTGYSQLIRYQPDNNKNPRTDFGAMHRQKIIKVSISGTGKSRQVIYGSEKRVWKVKQNGENQQIVNLYESKEKIIGFWFSTDSNSLEYGLTNGSLLSTSTLHDNLSMVFYPEDRPSTSTAYYTRCFSSDRENFLYIGKGFVPFIFDLKAGVVSWRGKNVPHDQLDLPVPIFDVDAEYIKGSQSIAVLNANRKIRIFDVRGNNRKPVKDCEIKSDPKSLMTKMLICNEQNTYYFANDIGSIWECDARKQFMIVGKFKGITTTVTDMAIDQGLLRVCSLDGNLRTFQRQTREQVSKTYMNTPLYSIACQTILQKKKKQKQKEFKITKTTFAQLNEDDDDKKNKNTHKVKQIRKRNKVGLKYLEPREFSDVQVKEEEQPKEDEDAWKLKLNDIDREQFEE